tara:strand:- start:44 stop:244 length:201 start_codon:yes stop_codon:yes gene_type:complete
MSKIHVDMYADAIDYCCKDMTGHNNWAYADKKLVETIMSKRNGDHPRSDRIHSVVIFYNDEIEEGI